MKRKIRCCWSPLTLCLGLVALLLAVNPAGAVNYTTTQISNNTYTYSPQINASGQVVWGGYSDSGYEIYLYSNGATTQISNNTYN